MSTDVPARHIEDVTESPSPRRSSSLTLPGAPAGLLCQTSGDVGPALHHLPDGCLNLIAEFLNTRELAMLSSTNSRLLRALDDAPCWQTLARIHFNDLQLLQASNNSAGRRDLSPHTQQSPAASAAGTSGLTSRQLYVLQVRGSGYGRHTADKVGGRQPLTLLRHGSRMLADVLQFMALPALIAWLPLFALLFVCLVADGWPSEPQALQQPASLLPGDDERAAAGVAAQLPPLVPPALPWWPAACLCAGVFAALALFLTVSLFAYVVASSTDATQHTRSLLAPFLRAVGAAWEATFQLAGCVRSSPVNPQLEVRERPTLETPRSAARSPWLSLGLTHAGHGLGPSTSALFAVLWRSIPFLPPPPGAVSSGRTTSASTGPASAARTVQELTRGGAVGSSHILMAVMLATGAVLLVLEARCGLSIASPKFWLMQAALRLLTVAVGISALGAALQSRVCWASMAAVVRDSQAATVAAAEAARRAVVSEETTGRNHEATAYTGADDLPLVASLALGAAVASLQEAGQHRRHVAHVTGLEALLERQAHGQPAPRNSTQRRDEDWSRARLVTAHARASSGREFMGDFYRMPACLGFILLLCVYPVVFQGRQRVITAPLLIPDAVDFAAQQFRAVNAPSINLTALADVDWWQPDVVPGMTGLPLTALSPALLNHTQGTAFGSDSWTYVRGSWPSLAEQMLHARAFAVERLRVNCSWSTPLLLWQPLLTLDSVDTAGSEFGLSQAQRSALPTDLHRILVWRPDVVALGLSTLPFRALQHACRSGYLAQAVFRRWVHSPIAITLAEHYTLMLQRHTTSALSAQCPLVLEPPSDPVSSGTSTGGPVNGDMVEEVAVPAGPTGTFARSSAFAASVLDTATVAVGISAPASTAAPTIPPRALEARRTFQRLAKILGKMPAEPNSGIATDAVSYAVSQHRSLCDTCGDVASAGEGNATVRCLAIALKNFQRPTAVPSADVTGDAASHAAHSGLTAKWTVVRAVMAPAVRVVSWVSVGVFGSVTWVLAGLKLLLLDAHSEDASHLGTVRENGEAAQALIWWLLFKAWDVCSPIPLMRWLWNLGWFGRVVLVGCQIVGMAIFGKTEPHRSTLHAVRNGLFPGSFITALAVIAICGGLRLFTYGVLQMTWGLFHVDGVLRSVLPAWLDRLATSPLVGLLPALSFYLSQGYVAAQVQDTFLHPDTAMAIAVLSARCTVVEHGRHGYASNPRLDGDPSANTKAARIPCRAPLWAYFLLAARKFVVASLLGVLVRQTIGAFAVPLLLRIPWSVYALPALLYFAGVGLLGITCVIATFHHSLHFWPQGNLRRLTGRGGEIAWGLLNPDGTLAGATPIWFGALPRDENVNVLDGQ